SFAAVLGIATLEPRMRGGMEVVVGRMAPEGHIAHGPLVAITRGLGYSLAATVATLPLVGSTFEEVPILGAIATLLALPAVPLLIVTSGLVAAIEPVWSFGASPIGWLAWLCAQWIVLVARLFAAVPGGTISTQGWSGWLAALWYGALFAWLGRDTLRRVATAAPGIMRTRAAEFASSQRFPGRRSLSWFGLPALMLAVLPWIAVAQSSGDRLSVTFFETDRGDMILVETSGGRQALIDGGRDVDGAAQALGETLPFWDRRIDVMVLTHSDADHVGGLVEVLGRYEVGAVVDTTGIAETDVFVEWRDRIGVLGAQVVEARTGMVVQLDDDVSLEVIWAGSSEFSETNAASTVLMLRHGEMRMLLTGDIPRSVESRLLGAGIPLAADVLKAPHHGSDTSSSGPFIDAVHPTVVVIPVGERNPFGHPDEDVLQRYADGVPDASVLITKDRGDVVVETDGERLWVTTDR
ncbi:MAG: MBL fold metallo-hydrolase, partial [Chloroflexi bacterium]|nr:MBL fold metallo-hydrolase [Chloroflexota bacterium]